MTETVSETIYCLIHELQVPLNTVRGAYEILSKELPASKELQTIGGVCEEFWAEVWDLREHLAEGVDLSSSTNAAAQIRELASGWRAYETTLSNSIGQIQNSGVVLGDSSLNSILNTVLPRGLERVKQMLSFLESLQPAQLTASEMLSKEMISTL